MNLATRRLAATRGSSGRDDLREERTPAEEEKSPDEKALKRKVDLRLHIP